MSCSSSASPSALEGDPGGAERVLIAEVECVLVVLGVWVDEETCGVEEVCE